MKLADEALIHDYEIKGHVKTLAERINRDLAGKEVIIVSVLNGAYIFTADLTRELTIDYTLGFVGVKSTEGSDTGKVRECKFFVDGDFKGKTVLLVDDIYDSGETLKYLKTRIIEKGADSAHLAVLVKKDHSRERKDLQIDYLGFTLPDKWLVGYGMDYNGKYRGLPYIGYVE